MEAKLTLKRGKNVNFDEINGRNLTSNDKVEAINGDGEMHMTFPIYIHGEMAYDIPYPRG